MFKHVPTVAILLIVQGSLELLLAAMLGLYALVYGGVALIPAVDRHSEIESPGAFMAVFGGASAVVAVIAIVLGAAAVLKIVAGIYNVRFQRRVLGIAALASCIVVMPSCYCAPTAAALLTLGLIVYLDSRTARAFELGESGASSDDVLRTMLGPEGPPPR